MDIVPSEMARQVWEIEGDSLQDINRKIDLLKANFNWHYSPRSEENQEGAQIDLLFDRPDGAITICEIKCSDNSFAIDKAYSQELLKKWKSFVSTQEQKSNFSFNGYHAGAETNDVF